MTFKELLTKAGLNKAELARRLGITPNAISAWKDSPPQYAVAYLELLTALKAATVSDTALRNVWAEK